MRLESIQRPSSSIRSVSSQLAKTMLDTVNTTDNGSERVCDDCWARLGRGRSATPPPQPHDEDVAYDVEILDAAADGIRNIALEVRAPGRPRAQRREQFRDDAPRFHTNSGRLRHCYSS